MSFLPIAFNFISQISQRDKSLKGNYTSICLLNWIARNVRFLPDQRRHCSKSLPLLKLQRRHIKEILQKPKSSVAENLHPVMTDKRCRVRLCKVWDLQNLLAQKLKFWLSVLEVSFCKMFLGIPRKEAAMSEDRDGEVVCRGGEMEMLQKAKWNWSLTPRVGICS